MRGTISPIIEHVANVMVSDRADAKTQIIEELQKTIKRVHVTQYVMDDDEDSFLSSSEFY